ncbi:hypothetical protein ACJX0J_041878, partial [Zea mays]
ILAGNGAVRSLTVNCSLLDDSAASVIAWGSLRDLLLLKSLKLEMAVCPYTLYPCLAPVYVGCVHLETLWVKFPLLDPLTTFRSYKALPSAPPSQLLPSKCTASLAPTWLCRPSVGSGDNNNEHSSGMAGTQQQRHSPPWPSPISPSDPLHSPHTVAEGYLLTIQFTQNAKRILGIEFNRQREIKRELNRDDMMIYSLHRHKINHHLTCKHLHQLKMRTWLKRKKIKIKTMRCTKRSRLGTKWVFVTPGFKEQSWVHLIYAPEKTTHIIIECIEINVINIIVYLLHSG